MSQGEPNRVKLASGRCELDEWSQCAAKGFKTCVGDAKLLYPDQNERTVVLLISRK